MKIPEARKVTQALAEVDNSLKTCLEALNQNAAKLMARGNYGGALGLASMGEDIQIFRAEADALRKKWDRIGGNDKENDEKHFVTPLESYYQPILRALIDFGGEARRSEIESRVGQLMKDRFEPGDYDPMSQGRSRWQLMIGRAHGFLVKEGWLERRAGRFWRITAAGREAATADASSAKIEAN